MHIALSNKDDYGESVYIGEYLNGKRHGYGSWYYNGVKKLESISYND